MSSPQLEDGYTRIANQLLDEILRYPFTKRQLAVLFAVIRKTYGYNKKADDISGRHLAQMTGIDRADCVRAVGELVEKGVLLKEKGCHGQRLMVNKRYHDWEGWGGGETPSGEVVNHHQSDGKSPPEVMVNHHQGGGKTPSEVVVNHHRGGGKTPLGSDGKSPHTKDNYQKTTIKRGGIGAEAPTSTPSRRRKPIKVPLPDPFPISDRVRRWAEKKGFDSLEDHHEAFCSKARANGYVYADWDEAFMTAIREDWAKLRRTNGVRYEARQRIDNSAPGRVARAIAERERKRQQGDVIEIEGWRVD